MPSTRNRTALFGIVGAIFVSGTGIGSLLPILPLYLRDRGASYALVGVIVGSALVAQALGQWPAGLLAERFGHRRGRASVAAGARVRLGVGGAADGIHRRPRDRWAARGVGPLHGFRRHRRRAFRGGDRDRPDGAELS